MTKLASPKQVSSKLGITKFLFLAARKQGQSPELVDRPPAEVGAVARGEAQKHRNRSLEGQRGKEHLFSLAQNAHLTDCSQSDHFSLTQRDP